MADGVQALRTALVADGTLTALVPVTRIAAGPLPRDTALPAIALESISKVDRNILNPGTHRFVRERVQARVLASTYPSLKQVMTALRGAAADTFPTVSGLINVTIHTDGAGPDFMNEDSSIHMGEQDFITTYSETR